MCRESTGCSVNGATATLAQLPQFFPGINFQGFFSVPFEIGFWCGVTEWPLKSVDFRQKGM
jgi:hypothetical protein